MIWTSFSLRPNSIEPFTLYYILWTAFPIQLHLKNYLKKLFCTFSNGRELYALEKLFHNLLLSFSVDHLYLAYVEVFVTTCDKKETSCASCLVTNFLCLENYFYFSLLRSNYLKAPQCDFYSLSTASFKLLPLNMIWAKKNSERDGNPFKTSSLKL